MIDEATGAYSSNSSFSSSSGSKKDIKMPWEYGHPTYTAIKSNRPILANEAEWFLKEIAKLEQELRVVNRMPHVVTELRKALDALYPNEG